MNEQTRNLMHGMMATAAVVELLVNPPALVSRREWQEYETLRKGTERVVRRLERYLGRKSCT